ncbi:hypothetical protein TIFTF001_016310 [Ficus carica]|uniref:Uncharacterized protein n=1 Tax=Ficus carica TaxID=3494 RepID=A0AA88DIT7_FICCA|nr:hypothetical protein TIFTF001_016310 [Ficus carica]
MVDDLKETPLRRSFENGVCDLGTVPLGEIYDGYGRLGLYFDGVESFFGRLDVLRWDGFDAHVRKTLHSIPLFDHEIDEIEGLG